MSNFVAYPKTPRLASPFAITEKIDGTNGAIVIEEEAWGYSPADDHPNVLAIPAGEERGEDGYPIRQYPVYAQSRNRFVTPQADNYGFAAWVAENAEALVKVLGPGRHYGEWWGHGIQRGYGLTTGDRRFSLFNAHRWDSLVTTDFGLSVVPVLATASDDVWLGNLATIVESELIGLRSYGSVAAPGFDRPEGVIVYHSRSSQVFKAFVDDIEKAAERALRILEAA